MAGVKPEDAPVQVASVDTLAASKVRPPADLVVVDEAHHATAETWREILSAYPKAWILGLTATPERGDGTALGNVFDTMITGPSIPELVDAGHLVDCDVIAPDSERNHLACEPVEAWQKWAGGRPGFVFARTIEQSRRLASQIPDAAHVDGSTPKDVRDSILERFRSGSINVLSSVFVFTEGVDLPRAGVCMLARGCGHAGTFLQMVGRVLRPHPLKERALLIDLVGAVHSHGLPTDERTYSLEGLPISTSEKVPPITQCVECGACWRSGTSRVCIRCKAELPPPKEPDVIDRKLSAVKRVLRPNASQEERSRNLEKWRNIARERGYKSSWASVRYKAVYGQWPRRW